MTIRHIGIIYLFFVAIIGNIFGGVYVQLIPHAELSSVIEQWGGFIPFNNPITVESAQLLTYYLYQTKLAILLVLCGLTCVGYPLVIVIFFLKAFLVGMNFKLFFTIFGADAWIYIAIWILPVYIITLAAYIILSQAMFTYTSVIVKNIKNKIWLSPFKSIQNSMLASILLIGLASMAHFFLSPFLHALLTS